MIKRHPSTPSNLAADKHTDRQKIDSISDMGSGNRLIDRWIRFAFNAI